MSSLLAKSHAKTVGKEDILSVSSLLSVPATDTASHTTGYKAPKSYSPMLVQMEGLCVRESKMEGPQETPFNNSLRAFFLQYYVQKMPCQK